MSEINFDYPVYDENYQYSEIYYVYVALAHTSNELMAKKLISDASKRLMEACYTDSYLQMNEPKERFPFVAMYSYFDQHNPNPAHDRTEETLFWTKDQFTRWLRKELTDNEFKSLMEKAEQNKWEITMEDGLHIVKPVKQVGFLTCKDDIVAAITVDYEAIAILDGACLI